MATDMPVDQFRQILWLPLKCPANFSPADGASPRWTRVTGDPLLAASMGDGATAETSDAAAYATYLYFHPYIRRFLFDEPREVAPGDPRALTIYELSHQEQFHFLDVANFNGQWKALAAVSIHRFRVARCLLYQFSLGVAILEVELAWTQSLRGPQNESSTDNISLAEVLDSLDFLRRTHPPYFDGDSLQNAVSQAGGRYPVATALCAIDEPVCTWGLLDADDQRRTAAQSALLASLQQRRQAMLSAVLVANRDRDGFAAPLSDPWRSLLGEWTATKCVQIEDERIPYMAFIAVPEPRRITRGDWVRLAFADHHVDSFALPYSEKFLSDFEEAHCYDRYFDPKVGWMSTRFLNTGYAFTMVGASAEGSYFTTAGHLHFRRHYACMGLLVQFTKAALLVFSNRLSEATAYRQRIGDKAYRDQIRTILRDLLEFTHRHRFEGVSNQLQATELYNMWSEKLQLPQLHAGVMAEANAAHQYVISEEERLQSQEQHEQTQIANRFTRGALYIALMGLLLAAMGAGFPFDKPLSLLTESDPLRECWQSTSGCLTDKVRVLVLAATTLTVGILLWLTWRPIRSSNKQGK